LVLSPESYNKKVGSALFCPITSKSKGYAFEVAVPSGLKVSGVILSDQIKSFDWKARKIKRIGTLPEARVFEVQHLVQVLLLEG